MNKDMHYLQSRRTYLLYKKANWLTSQMEDSELDQINKEINRPPDVNKTPK